jgi:imidazole glycerol-phosphate synthase subunit HisF
MKRIIFTLLHCDGHYMLSRNFRLQRIGDIDWVLRHYEIQRVSLGIDEIMILDVSRGDQEQSGFRRDVKRLVETCFIPVTVGGRLRSRDDVSQCFDSGADKVLINSAFFDNQGFCEGVAAVYGSQALIAGVDVVDGTDGMPESPPRPFVGREQLREHIRRAVGHGAGEVLVQSVDRDGTGNGLDLSLVELAQTGPTPLILMGGVGQPSHIVDGLRNEAVDAVATANLLNFIGDTLIESRVQVQAEDSRLAMWSPENLERLRGTLQRENADEEMERTHG